MTNDLDYKVCLAEKINESLNQYKCMIYCLSILTARKGYLFCTLHSFSDPDKSANIIIEGS